MTEILSDVKSLDSELKEAADDIQETAQSISVCGHNVALDECAKKLLASSKTIRKMAGNRGT